MGNFRLFGYSNGRIKGGRITTQQHRASASYGGSRPVIAQYLLLRTDLYRWVRWPIFGGEHHRNFELTQARYTAPEDSHPHTFHSLGRKASARTSAARLSPHTLLSSEDT